MISFQKAEISDALTIVKIRQKAWAATYRGIYPDEMIDHFDYSWHLQKETARLMSPQFYCFLVMDGGTCAGYFSYGRVSPETWKDFSFRLHSFYLLPEYQGRGLGRQIFSYVAESCRRMGYDRMFLDCHPDNHKAMDFYQHMGGVVAGVDYGTGNREEYSCTIEFELS